MVNVIPRYFSKLASTFIMPYVRSVSTQSYIFLPTSTFKSTTCSYNIALDLNILLIASSYVHIYIGGHCIGSYIIAIIEFVVENHKEKFEDM